MKMDCLLAETNVLLKINITILIDKEKNSNLPITLMNLIWMCYNNEKYSTHFVIYCYQNINSSFINILLQLNNILFANK